MNIIFDLDGTLFETGYCVINAVKKLFAELELSIPDETSITQGIGMKAYEFLQNILPENINPTDVIDKYHTLERNEIAENSLLFPNVPEMLETLTANGHFLYISSSGSIEYVNFVLSNTGIEKYFTDIYSAAQNKSKSEIVSEILKKNSNSIVIGDTIYDIESANSNNIPSIAVTYGYGKSEDLQSATFIIDNASDIIGIVNQIQVFNLITEQTVKQGKQIIGINGVDTSGKTSFTNNYSRFLNSINIKSSILHIDDFHNPSELRYKGDNQIDAYYNNAFNYDQVINEVLNPLKENGFVNTKVTCLNLDTDKYENVVEYNIDNDTVLLIEGVLLLRKPLLEYFDSAIFLHIDFDEVLKRAEIRDVPKYGKEFLQKYIDKYIPIQKRYISEYNPHETCDFVIDNNDYINPKILKP